MSNGRYRAYPKYKDSGVEWLGSTPQHWELSPLKYLAKFSGGGTPNKDTAAFWNGNIPWVSPKDMKGRFVDRTIDNVTPGAIQQSTTNILPEGALLLVVRSGILQHSIPAAINRVPVTLNQDMKALRFGSKMTAEFAQYFVVGNQRPLLLEWCKQGATVESIEQELLGSSRVPIPPLPEQTQIAKFLDHETAKIDRLIEKQEALIRLLKEKRQAVISHAVTKGLNPHAPLKNSGIAWLGQVPAHWVVNRVKYNASLAGRIGFRGYTTDDLVDEGEGAITLSPSNFDGGNLTFEKKTYISWRKYHESPEIKLAVEDIVMVKTGSTLGKIGFVDRVDEPMTINPQIVIFKEVKLRSLFLFHYLASPLIQSLVKVSNTGGTMPTMTQECIGNYPLLFPPLNEQDEIVAVVSEHWRKFNGLIEQAQRAVTLLQERRTALISAAVTGKIDVRHWQPREN